MSEINFISNTGGVNKNRNDKNNSQETKWTDPNNENAGSAESKSILKKSKHNREIYDYNVDINHSINSTTLDVTIKLNKVIESIKMNITIKGDEI